MSDDSSIPPSSGPVPPVLAAVWHAGLLSAICYVLTTRVVSILPFIYLPIRCISFQVAHSHPIHAPEDDSNAALSVRPSVRLSVRLSICPSVRPSVHPSIHPSVCPSIRLSVCPPTCPPDAQWRCCCCAATSPTSPDSDSHTSVFRTRLSMQHTSKCRPTSRTSTTTSPACSPSSRAAPRGSHPCVRCTPALRHTHFPPQRRRRPPEHDLRAHRKHALASFADAAADVPLRPHSTGPSAECDQPVEGAYAVNGKVGAIDNVAIANSERWLIQHSAHGKLRERQTE